VTDLTADGYRHEALLYDGPDELVSWTAGFVREALEADEPVLVALPRPRLAPLRFELGADAAEAKLVDLDGVGRNPARIIAVWRDFVDRHPGRRTRGVGEPAWAGRSEAELVECDHHEALLNVAIAPITPLWLVCPYDVGALDGATVAGARRNHPVVCQHGHRAASDAYAVPGPESVLGRALPQPPAEATVLEFGPRGVASARALARARALAEGLPPGSAGALELAVHEVAANTVRHGGGHGTLGVWRAGDELVCEIRDGGTLADPLLGRRQPELGATGGRGLWMVNQLCDLVQLRSADGVTVVRMHMSLVGAVADAAVA
jgi:anti-sigma regulatory factor (Ser/Thr protein kinase)